jgi:hypothetical protein
MAEHTAGEPSFFDDASIPEKSGFRTDRAGAKRYGNWGITKTFDSLNWVIAEGVVRS